MFTGIIECLGRVASIEYRGQNLEFVIESPLSHELKPEQSLSHNGVCLTVTNSGKLSHSVTAIKETLSKSNLSMLKTGDLLNLERCMKADGRFDGHIVQGHVDCTAICRDISDQNGSKVFHFEYEKGSGETVEKGSVTVNGISLTVFNSKPVNFSVAIIPYTMEHTNMQYVKSGDLVNLEFDILGKYIRQYFEKTQIHEIS